jgi:NADP-dependent 3-hydroxy acid dehydrogenase YdfG
VREETVSKSGVLAGKRILITGAGGGISSEVARHAVEAGAEVILADLDGCAAEKVASELKARDGKAFAYRLDVTNLQDVKALAVRVAEEAGDIDDLVNCAGVSLGERFEDADFIDKWRLSFSVNCDGNFGSTCSFASGNCLTGYAATKAAIKPFTQTLSRDLRRVRILWVATCSRRVAASRNDRQPQEDPQADARARSAAAPPVPLRRHHRQRS